MLHRESRVFPEVPFSYYKQGLLLPDLAVAVEKHIWCVSLLPVLITLIVFIHIKIDLHALMCQPKIMKQTEPR